MPVRYIQSIVFAAVTCVSMIVTSAFAGHNQGEASLFQGAHKRQQHQCELMGRGVLRGLALTSEQKTAIRQIVKAQQAAYQASNEQSDLQANRDQLKAIITASDFDINEAEQWLMAKQQQLQQRMLMKIHTQHKIFQLLTQEQRQKFEKRMEKCGNRHKHT